MTTQKQLHLLKNIPVVSLATLSMIPSKGFYIIQFWRAMLTGMTKERVQRETFVIAEGLSLCFIATVALAMLGFGTYLHILIHSEDSCTMTYMYRELQFQNIKLPFASSNRYSFFVYNEGYYWLNRIVIEPGQIPVLFIPGSQGSGKQIRSLASVMQNKTEMRRSSISFRFFAVDFDDEMTFLNGNMVTRQLEYVMEAIRKIKSMLSVKRKIVLFGHSYGGMVALYAAIHSEFQNDIELIITKGAPINHQPIMNDWLSLRHSISLKDQWFTLQSSTLKHIGVVAYTAGLKDYQVYDEWSIMPNVTHRPLWSIYGVPDLAADHRSILWCNEFVRHVSRLLWSYAENRDLRTGREIVQNFYEQEAKQNFKRAGLVRHINDIPSKQIRVNEIYNGFQLNEKQFALVLTANRFDAVLVRANASCLNSITTVRYNETLMGFKNSTNGLVETWIYRAVQGEKVHLLLDVMPPCKVDIAISYPTSVNIARVYEITFSHLPEVFGTVIPVCVFYGVLVRWRSAPKAIAGLVINSVFMSAIIMGLASDSDALSLPLTVGYIIALAWRGVCVVIDWLILSRLKFIRRGHLALRDDKLMNGLFFIGSAITIMASNEGSIFLIILLAYHHHPKTVFLVVPALVPYFMKLVGVPFFTTDTVALYDLQYQPSFYAGTIYMLGLVSGANGERRPDAMFMLTYGMTPVFLYLVSSPWELQSAFTLIILSAARFTNLSEDRVSGSTSSNPPGDKPHKPDKPKTSGGTEQGQRWKKKKEKNSSRKRRN